MAARPAPVQSNPIRADIVVNRGSSHLRRSALNVAVPVPNSPSYRTAVPARRSASSAAAVSVCPSAASLSSTGHPRFVRGDQLAQEGVGPLHVNAQGGQFLTLKSRMFFVTRLTRGVSDQQAASGSAEQGVGICDDGDHHLGSACEDFAVEVRAEVSDGAAAAHLLAPVPGQHGRLQDTPLVSYLLVQGAQGKAGRIALSLLRMHLVILDELGYLPFSQAGGALLFHCSAVCTSTPV
jgi:hypothetical protein